MREAWPDAERCPDYRRAPPCPVHGRRLLASLTGGPGLTGRGRPAADVPGWARRETSLSFMQTMHPVAMRILSCFATGLGLPADYFVKVRRWGALWCAPLSAASAPAHTFAAGQLTHVRCLQTTDVSSADNRTFLQYHKVLPAALLLPGGAACPASPVRMLPTLCHPPCASALPHPLPGRTP